MKIEKGTIVALIIAFILGLAAAIMNDVGQYQNLVEFLTGSTILVLIIAVISTFEDIL